MVNECFIKRSSDCCWMLWNAGSSRLTRKESDHTHTRCTGTHNDTHNHTHTDAPLQAGGVFGTLSLTQRTEGWRHIRGSTGQDTDGLTQRKTGNILQNKGAEYYINICIRIQDRAVVLCRLLWGGWVWPLLPQPLQDSSGNTVYFVPALLSFSPTVAPKEKLWRS